MVKSEGEEEKARRRRGEGEEKARRRRGEGEEKERRGRGEGEEERGIPDQTCAIFIEEISAQWFHKECQSEDGEETCLFRY